MNISDSKKEYSTQDITMQSSQSLPNFQEMLQMWSMHLLSLLRKIHPTGFQLPDHWKEIQIGLYTMSILKDGFNVGHF
jgi:hypothetical protein